MRARRCRPTRWARRWPGAVPGRPGASSCAGWAARFTTLFSQSIYKWVQSPLSLHVGSLDLDRERALQMPVVQKTEWTRSSEPAPTTARAASKGAKPKVARFTARASSKKSR